MRIDIRAIVDLIPSGAKIIDLGCGSGELLQILVKEKEIDGVGIEIAPERVSLAISRGISVIQDDLEAAIVNYGDNTFDYAILSQTIQELKHPEKVLSEIVRVSQSAIVAIYNLAELKYRFRILFTGRFPKSKDLPYDWLTTNIALLSVSDFREFCAMHGFKIQKEIFLRGTKQIMNWPNLRAKLCIFQITRK